MRASGSGSVSQGKKITTTNNKMGLLELCQEAFGAGDLYQVLGVRPEASANEIRRGYHRVSLQVHPDRAEPADKERSTRHFQILGKVYAVLSDEEQRTLYDQQGIVDEESTVLTQDCNWEEYWRLLFKKITVKNIKDFEKKYKHSTEELEDVKAAYEDFKGDMDKIMESVLCVDYTDEPRIRQIIQHAIDSGELPSYKSFVNESKRKINARKRKAEKEAKEAEESREQMGLDEGDDDLKVLIQSRMDSRKKEMEDFVARMEAKYADKSKKGGKKATAKK